MSLDPRDSRRRGRSKSPGRRREDDDDGRRSHSKVRAPSPPSKSSKYDYRDAAPDPSRGSAYEYGRHDPAAVVDAEPRAYGYGYDAYGRPEYGASTGGYTPQQPVAQYTTTGGGYAPVSKPEYAVPGAFTDMPDVGDVGRYATSGPETGRYAATSGPVEGGRYATSGGAPGVREREKDYYSENKSYGGKGYGKRDEYVRDASPSRRDKKERSSRYEESPPKSSRYEDDKYKYGGSEYDSKRYEDDRSGKDKYKEDKYRDDKYKEDRYKDDKYRDDKYKSDKYRNDKYGEDKYKQDKYGEEKYKDDKYRNDKYNDDKYGKDKYKEDRYGKDEKTSRERGASFNVSAGQHSFSGGVNLSHEKPSSYVRPPSPSDFAPPGALGNPSYAEAPKYNYSQPDPLAYARKNDPPPPIAYSGRPASPPYGGKPGYGGKYQDDSARSSKSQIVTVEPGSRNKRDASPGPGAYRHDPSPNLGLNPGLNRGMHSLSVSTGHHGSASLSLAAAPGSPLLESYHGTYQSISPMPSPLMIANAPHSDVNFIDALSPESSSDDERRGKKKRTARFHDPADEAKILSMALKGDKRAPDLEPLIEILPGLTHEQILDLRVEYKRIVKTGSEKKGVNIAKHIKLRLKEEDPSLMKACYVCALGKWESEAYWANFWYQGEKSRRELLIESLMGRTNDEIADIKDGFQDKKYSDSLVKCMKTELKEDKFKKAVLLVLEEKKIEDRGGYSLDRDLIADDVSDLYRAVRSEKGGETAMINIVIVRSDAHMREVLRLYESTYRANFAREMLKKSGNLVGELLAHILNGIINKPVRDALLVQHALSLSKSDSIRTELLISRLVRYHWDRPHMEAVKREYRTRYGVDMQKAVREGTRGDWGRFCEELCVRRMGDEVRRMGVDDYRN